MLGSGYRSPYHYREKISVYLIENLVGSRAGESNNWYRDPARTDILAAIQSLDTQDVIELGLRTGSAAYWLRCRNLQPLSALIHGIGWRGRYYDIHRVNDTPGLDTELYMELTSAKVVVPKTPPNLDFRYPYNAIHADDKV